MELDRDSSQTIVSAFNSLSTIIELTGNEQLRAKCQETLDALKKEYPEIKQILFAYLYTDFSAHIERRKNSKNKS